MVKFYCLRGNQLGNNWEFEIGGAIYWWDQMIPIAMNSVYDEIEIFIHWDYILPWQSFFLMWIIDVLFSGHAGEVKSND